MKFEVINLNTFFVRLYHANKMNLITDEKTTTEQVKSKEAASY